MAVELLKLDETVSTNLWLREHGGREDMVVWTDYQSAGRGCGTNTWESERGQNLLFSMLYHPDRLPAAQQFRISMAVALALRDELTRQGLADVTIKWPNDIYWRDSKLAGILIENQLHGAFLQSSIIGVGLNVNQEVFLSDAPNPVSMRQIADRRFDRESLLRGVVDAMEHRLKTAADLSDQYQQALYRRAGVYPYCDMDGRFEAVLVGVKPDGRLVLRDTDGRVRTYAFKEVTFCLGTT